MHSYIRVEQIWVYLHCGRVFSHWNSCLTTENVQTTWTFIDRSKFKRKRETQRLLWSPLLIIMIYIKCFRKNESTFYVIDKTKINSQHFCIINLAKSAKSKLVFNPKWVNISTVVADDRQTCTKRLKHEKTTSKYIIVVFHSQKKNNENID